MAAPVRPTATKAYLRSKWVFVPTVAAPGAPTVSELTGASALDVTNMLFESSARPAQSTNLARSPRRIGDATSYEFVGESQLSLGEFRYSFDPQSAALATGRKAYEKFPAGTTGYLYNRLGIDRDTDIIATHKVTGYPVEFGPQQETTEGDAEGAEVAIVQTVAITGPKAGGSRQPPASALSSPVVEEAMAHVQIKTNEHGVPSLIVDGVDLSMSVLAEGAVLDLSQIPPRLTVTVIADALEADLPVAVVEALAQAGDSA
jgi:hypothetical protein